MYLYEKGKKYWTTRHSDIFTGEFHGYAYPLSGVEDTGFELWIACAAETVLIYFDIYVFW